MARLSLLVLFALLGAAHAVNLQEFLTNPVGLLPEQRPPACRHACSSRAVCCGPHPAQYPSARACTTYTAVPLALGAPSGAFGAWGSRRWAMAAARLPAGFLPRRKAADGVTGAALALPPRLSLT